MICMALPISAKVACLARRLVENKVRYIEVSRGGWDTHGNNFEAVANNCADVDKALGCIYFMDLEMRGLLQGNLSCSHF